METIPLETEKTILRKLGWEEETITFLENVAIKNGKTIEEVIELIKANK